MLTSVTSKKKSTRARQVGIKIHTINVTRTINESISKELNKMILTSSSEEIKIFIESLILAQDERWRRV